MVQNAKVCCKIKKHVLIKLILVGTSCFDKVERNKEKH